MRRFDGLDKYTPPPGGTALTIGNFDGVHLGHVALVSAAREAARPHSASVVAMTFDPHPAAIFAPGREPPLLTTLPRRLELLEAAGADAAIVLRSEPALFALTADEFLDQLIARCHLRAIVEGLDFSFGRARAGTIATLRAAGERIGFSTIVVEPVHAAQLADAPQVSSSAIRAALRAGDLPRARAMLGRNHVLTGTVQSGDGRGSKLSFPTANVSAIPEMLPLTGVYAAIATTPTRKKFAAAVNIGPQPTFDQPTTRVEAHLLDFRGDLLGAQLELELVEHIRGQQRFASVDELIARIGEDVRRTRAIIAATLSASPPAVSKSTP